MSEQLARVIADHAPHEGITATLLDGFFLYRSDQVVGRNRFCYEPTICVVAQSRKRVYTGDRYYDYDPNNYLINAVAMPVEGEVPEATADEPYLGLSLRIDSYIVSELIVEMDRHSLLQRDQIPDLISACPLTERLTDAFTRLIRTCQDPMDSDVLAAAVKREIFYEVLKGPRGEMLRNSIAQHSGANRVAPVIHFIEENYHRPLVVEELASVAGMSPSSLHEHFKQATSMSPLQFMKSLRLHKARTLLLNGSQAAEACWKVGYGSPSQFSREFKRFFGESPRDVQVMVRAAIHEGSAAH
ncbi:AraC family transcriptional regulator [Marinobacterium jannaschii]|uniref:AraC family transcriptional regulator n=1 Tax=Marinobacterium jannaschii TaxID=64970 RepID=UPI0006875944|nr:AraC family transcriptional regulator [Marinobacterium jannaschii]